MPQFVDASRPVIPQFLLMIVTFVGLGALLVAAHLQMVFSNVIAASLLPAAWYWLAMEWMILAAGISVLLVAFRKYLMPPKPELDDEDINTY